MNTKMIIIIIILSMGFIFLFYCKNDIQNFQVKMTDHQKVLNKLFEEEAPAAGKSK